MRPPSVYDVTMPSSHKTSRMTISVESKMTPFDPSPIVEGGLASCLSRCAHVHERSARCGPAHCRVGDAGTNVANQTVSLSFAAVMRK